MQHRPVLCIFRVLSLVLCAVGCLSLGAQETSEEAGSGAAPSLTLRGQAEARIDTGAVDAKGQVLTISCMTCHSMLQPQTPAQHPQQLQVFHQGLSVQHGGNTCYSCHNPNDYNTLRLADGRRVPFPSAMDLCSQCHGPARRDYDRGAHGGLAGHWDATQGPQTRNTCLACHDAHAPAYQAALPVAGPRDRFLVQPVQSEEAGHE